MRQSAKALKRLTVRRTAYDAMKLPVGKGLAYKRPGSLKR